MMCCLRREVLTIIYIKKYLLRKNMKKWYQTICGSMNEKSNLPAILGRLG